MVAKRSGQTLGFTISESTLYKTIRSCQKTLFEEYERNIVARLTIKVENTKSSSYKPQYGLEDMSPITAAPTPITCKNERRSWVTVKFQNWEVDRAKQGNWLQPYTWDWAGLKVYTLWKFVLKQFTNLSARGKKCAIARQTWSLIKNVKARYVAQYRLNQIFINSLIGLIRA